MLYNYLILCHPLILKKFITGLCSPPTPALRGSLFEAAQAPSLLVCRQHGCGPQIHFQDLGKLLRTWLSSPGVCVGCMWPLSLFLELLGASGSVLFQGQDTLIRPLTEQQERLPHRPDSVVSGIALGVSSFSFLASVVYWIQALQIIRKVISFFLISARGEAKHRELQIRPSWPSLPGAAETSGECWLSGPSSEVGRLLSMGQLPGSWVHHGLHSLTGQLTWPVPPACVLLDWVPCQVPPALGLGARLVSVRCSQKPDSSRWPQASWDGGDLRPPGRSWGQDSWGAGARPAGEQYAGSWLSGHECFHRWESSMLSWACYFTLSR